MKNINQVFFLTILLLMMSPVLQAQQTKNGVPSQGQCGGCAQTRDGSGTLGLTYKRDTCGLTYMTLSERVGQRFPPPGVVQPITKTVSGLPPCYQIDKAFLWIDASGSGIPITATITNPQSVTQNFPMAVIGSGPDKCWGYAGSFSYRADVTSIVSGNGNYQFSGFPVSTSTSGEDVDGFMMMIIYRDLSATWEGHLLIHDGADVQIATATTQSVTPVSACGSATAGTSRSFCIIADVQNVGSVVSMDNVPQVFNQEYWNYLDQPMTQITPATLGVDYSVTASGECYNLMMAGVYYQTTSCNVCFPGSTVPLTLTSTGSSSCIPGTGTVTTTVSGGTAPYTYNWQPGSYTTQTVNNLPAGTYTVIVTDATGCAVGVDSAVVSVTAAQLALVSSGSSLCTSGNGSVTTTPSGGTAPYTYNWQPGGFNTQTVNGLAPGNYTVTVTDATGCAAGTDIATVAVLGYPTAQFSITPSPVAIYPGQICMTDQTVGATQWQWFVNNTPASNASNFCYTLPDTGTYCVNLIAANAGGCPDTAQNCILSLLEEEASLYIPNAFTPNGSGLNELFMPVGEGITNDNYSFMIFDRWGMLLYESKTWGQGWDGTFKGRICQQDVYVWKLRCTDIKNKKYQRIGHVSLIR
jgi:gliding motility-associated-like protein